MIKYRDFTYVGEVTFDAIKQIIMKDNQYDKLELRYSFMIHFDESEDNTKPENAAIISWVERRICKLLKCKSRRDCGPNDIIFYDLILGDSIIWNRLDTIPGRIELIELGINIINVTTRVYNLTKE